MIFLEYGCYEDTETFIIDECILHSFKSVYEYMDKGYRDLNYELEISKVIKLKSNTLNVKEWIENKGEEWMDSKGSYLILENIKVLCNHYDINRFWFNGINILEGDEVK